MSTKYANGGIPGPQGPPGTDGTNGTNGTNAAAGTHATMWHDESTVLAGAPIGLGVDPTDYYNGGAYQAFATGAPNMGDSFYQTFVIQPGTYALTIVGKTGDNYGQVSWYIDSILQGMTDFYSASNVINITSLTVVVPSGTSHTLLGVISGKNAASSNYYFLAAKYYLRQ